MSATAAPLVNGFTPSAHGSVNEVLEYEKILKLRDEIFAGSHPRLTVPAHVLQKLPPSHSQFSSQTTTVVQPTQVALSQLPGLNITSLQEEEQNKQKISSPAAPLPAATTPSGIDPVLLTKSADLIKAEIQLQRQRLEKQLRDQFEQKRLEFRKRPSPAEAKPDFDVPTLLAKALEIAKPDLPEEGGEDSDSFDENSFYSSRAPDSVAGEEEQSHSSQEQSLQEQSLQDSFGTNGHQDAVTSFAQQTAPRGPPPPRPSPPPGLNPLAITRPMPVADSARKPVPAMNRADDMEDEDEEGEYSPPEALDQYPTPHNYGSQAIPDIRTRPMRRYSDLDQNGKRAASPSGANMRIVRNQITSPIAPQPSRVSPLALTKDYLALQDRRLRNGRQRGRGESASESPEPPGPRKKRKLERKAEKKARKVKQENVSPPPFHDIQPLGSGKPQRLDERPIVIDDSPSQDIRYARAPARYVEPPPRPMSRHVEQIMPLSEPRATSRTMMRPLRDNRDLRRVASMQSMHVEQPRDYVEYATPTRTRGTSYLPVESPVREAPPLMPSDFERQSQEIRIMRTPAPQYRDVYQEPEPEIRYIPEPMPPAPRERIVVDQYGQRFREIIQDRASVAPRTMSSSYAAREPGQYYEGGERNRAASIMVDERPLPRLEHDMPPPRMVRQVAESPRTTTSGVIAQRETYNSMPQGRASSVQVFDQPARHMIYADDPGDFRPPVRMSSVRPAPSQYEDRAPLQVLSRSGSVRPGREGSVFLDDRAPMRREYVSAEQPRYRVVEPEPRFVDAQGHELVAIHDGGQEGGFRYIQRY